MLYEESLYEGSLYGASTSGEIDGRVTHLNAYQNEINNIIFYWTIEPFNGSLKNFIWDLEIDRVKSFDSVDKKVISNIGIGVNGFELGVNFVGYVLPISELSYIDVDGDGAQLFWRVKAKVSDTVSIYSPISQYRFYGYNVDYFVNKAFSVIPDIIINKSKTSNLYKIFYSICKEIAVAWRRAKFVELDYYIDTVRDSEIERIFGALVRVYKPSTLSYFDYREILKGFVKNVKRSPSVLSFSNLIYSIFINYPSFSMVRDEIDCFVGNENLYVYIEGNEGVNSGSFCLSEYDYRFGIYVDIIDKRDTTDRTKLTNNFIYDIIKKMIPVNVNIYIRGII